MKTVTCLRLVVATMLAMGALCPPQAVGPDAGALLLEDTVGCQRGAGHLQLDERQHEPVRPGSLRAGRSECRRHTGHGGLRAHLHTVRSLGHGCSHRAHGADLGRGHGGRQDVRLSRPAGSAIRCSSSTSTSSARGRRRTSSTCCATSRSSRSTSSADLAFPIGEYNNSQPLNLGQNRWYGRVGVPIIWQLGPWVPGRRTTLEFLPAVWLFGTNDNYVGGTMKTDPMFQLDAHLTRDFTENFWGCARRGLVHRRQGNHQRRRGREAQQRRHWIHGRVPDQRQPGPHRRLQDRPSTTALPRTFAWIVSWSRLYTDGTRSSKARSG